MHRLHMIGEGKETRKSGTYDSHEHQKAALDVARESVILLKMKTICYRFRKEKRQAKLQSSVQMRQQSTPTAAEVQRLRRFMRFRRCLESRNFSAEMRR